MSTLMTLPVSDIIQVNVQAAQPPVAPRAFNQGLIVGPSAVIPSTGANSRIRQYASLNAMLTDGFTNTEPEYLAASLYFGQAEPAQFVWVGRQDLTAIQTAIPHSGNAGTGYVVGDKITVVQSGASGGILTVLTITSGGVVATLGTTVGSQGTAYSDATGLATTGGSGTGLEVDITAIGETYLQAVEACALVNTEWYGFMCCNATDADHTALAGYSTANYLTVMYFGSSSTATIPAGTAGNILLTLQAAKQKCVMEYATNQGGTFPNNLYAAGALMGLAMGLNTGAPGSAFTLALKSLVGVAPEPITQTQYTNIVNANGNVCASFGPYTGLLMNGICSNGNYFDQLLDRAIYVNLIQTNLMNLLTSVPKIPQTDPGEHQLIAQVDAAAQQMVTLGFFGPGVWNGPNILTGLVTGQALPLGFLNQAQSFALQSAGARAARQAMPIYSAILESGAVQFVLVQVNTQT